MGAVETRWRVRQVVNVVNLSTPVGLLVAVAGRATVRRGPDGLLLARGFRLGPVRVPAPAFTVGNVVIVRRPDDPERPYDDALARRPTMLAHESRHASQYACCLGPVMLPLYAVAALWSMLRCGDPSSYNVFEVRAGLADGGYVDRRRDRRLA